MGINLHAEGKAKCGPRERDTTFLFHLKMLISILSFGPL
jgi:hypothetical protein